MDDAGRGYNSAPAQGPLPATKAGAFAWARSFQATEQDGIAISMKDDRKHTLSFDSITAGGRGPIHQTMEVDRTK